MEERMLPSLITLGYSRQEPAAEGIAENPSYQKTIAIFRRQEQGKEQFREISEAAETALGTAVNSVAKKGDACGSCGYCTHRGKRCLATGRTCNTCGGFHRLARACKSAPSSRSFRGKTKELRLLCADADDLFLQMLTVNTVNTDHYSAMVNIEGQPITCKLNRGANCCVISKKDVDQKSIARLR